MSSACIERQRSFLRSQYSRWYHAGNEACDDFQSHFLASCAGVALVAGARLSEFRIQRSSDTGLVTTCTFYHYEQAVPSKHVISAETFAHIDCCPLSIVLSPFPRL